jgi:hypothetical protein
MYTACLSTVKELVQHFDVFVARSRVPHITLKNVEAHARINIITMIDMELFIEF